MQGGKISTKEADINAARKRGIEVETKRKMFGGRNASHAGPSNAAKLENEDEAAPIARVSANFGQALQQARMAKKITQSDLAKAINEKPTVVAEYENGKAIPNGQIITKMQRVLGCQLPKAALKPKVVKE